MKRFFNRRLVGTALLGAVIALLFTASPAMAAAPTWDGDTSVNWHDAGNWNTGLVPVAGDTVTIASGTTFAPTISDARSLATLTINSGATLTIAAAGSLTASGDVTGIGTGTLTNTAGGTVSLAGNLTIPATGTFSSSTTVFTGSAAQLITNGGTLTLTDVIVNKSGANALSLAQNTPIGGNLTVTAGVFDLVDKTANRSVAGGTLTVANGATLKIGGTNPFPTNYTTHILGTTSTVEYSGTTQAVSAETYGHLTLSGTGTKTSAGNTIVNGTFAIGTGSIFDAGSYTHQLKGNVALSGTGTFTAGTGTVYLNGSTTQTIDTPLATGITFNNLVVANTTSLASSGVSLLTTGGNVTVNGILTLASGRLTTNTPIVIANSTVSGGSSTAYIDGNLRRAITASAGSQTVDFPIGKSTSYTPVSVTFPTGVTSTAGTLTFSSTAAKHAAFASSGLNQTTYVNRYWTATVGGALAPIGSYNATFTFINPGDFVGSPSTAALQVKKYTGGTWSSPASSSSTATTATGTGFTAFSDYAVGVVCADGTFSGTVASPGTADTDCSGDGATSSVPVETVLTRPSGGSSGTVTISNAAPSGGPSGYTLFGRQVSITTPAATAASPNVITFYVDSSVIPSGTTYQTINVFKDSATSPVLACSGSPGQASPDPCVASRALGSGTDANDAVITIRSSTASTWRFAGASTVKCAGLTATIVGTTGNDTLYGTAGNDVIYADAGNDTVYGKGGNDVICLGPGGDTAYGGDGNDEIRGGSGSDIIYGKRGDDTLKGQGGGDTLTGAKGDDLLKGGAGNDLLYGGVDDDDLYGGSGTDTGYGGAGTNYCFSTELGAC